MIQYRSFGPFPISTNTHGFLDRAVKKKKSEFWEGVRADVPDLVDAKGCYLFCTGAAKNIKPWYVGKTNGNKGFFGEVFQPHKLDLYHQALEKYKNKRVPSFIFIARITPAGKFAKTINDSELDWLEKLLIGSAHRRNKELTNIKDTKLLKNLVIPGFFGNAGQGMANNLEARALKRCLG